MGLSVAISGGIILTVFVLILLSLPGLADKMFSIGDITTQVTQHEQKISNTEISMNYLSQLVGKSKVNFTLNNDGSEKLWNFEDFDLFIEYNGAISEQTTQQLSYSGECPGAVPQAGNWCIQSISNDIVDPKILNSGEIANIRTNLSENLASTTAVVTLVTDNGVTFTTSSSFNTLESLTNVTDTGCAVNNIIKVNSTGFWDCAEDTEKFILKADVTCASTAPAYCTVFTIPLTNSQGNSIDVFLIGDSSVAGGAIQMRVQFDNAGNDGYCTYRTYTTATAEVLDVLRATAITDTGETVWLAVANVPIPLRIECAFETDASAGNALVQIQQEVASTGTIQMGSYYIKTP